MSTQASYSVPTIERLTRPQILKRFLRESGLGQYGTVTSGDTASLVDSKRLRNRKMSDEAVAGWAYILSTSDNQAPEGESLAIHEYSPELGKISLDGVLEAALGSGDEYGIFAYIHPQDVLDHLDEILKHELYLPSWAILSAVPDSDMEQSGTDDWSATNASISKDTNEPSMNGSRWLKVAATDDDGYAESATIHVTPSRRYHCSALVRGDGSTQATLTVYDETNGTTLATSTTSATAMVRLVNDFTVPTGCRSIKVRLATVTDGQVTYWDDVSVFSYADQEVPLPWWVRSGAQVKGFFRLQPWNIENTDSGQVWTPAYRGVRDNRWDIRDDAFRGQLRAIAKFGQADLPVFIKGTRNETAFADNTDAKHVDPNLINAGLCHKAFQQISAHRVAANMNLEWAKAQRERWRTEWETLKRRHLLRLEEDEQSPQMYMPVYRDNRSNLGGVDHDALRYIS